MKKLYIFGFLALTSCLGFKELPVDYDYSYKGNFKKYRTFDMMKSLNSADSSMINASIEKSITARMKFLGYKKTGTRPHLIISYKMYFDSLRFNGYEQPDIETWIKNKKEDLSYDKRKYNLKTGTLLIQFYDRRQNRSIWQGYATTLYGNIDFGNQRHLRNAVISILDKYRFWADGFIEQQADVQEEVDNP
ncbi:MAG: DUF4136 domain-containing protein [Bacteroidetes bacterium]|nr:DUF4136 domain-containing protein [Bacteroidota bacterium]MBI3482353.1 DUF4136 domain-containing protein [Bacteroidota bacterium]